MRADYFPSSFVRELTCNGDVAFVDAHSETVLWGDMYIFFPPFFLDGAFGFKRICLLDESNTSVQSEYFNLSDFHLHICSS